MVDVYKMEKNNEKINQDQIQIVEKNSDFDFPKCFEEVQDTRKINNEGFIIRRLSEYS